MSLPRTLWSLGALLLVLVGPAAAQVKLEHKLTPGETIQSKETLKATQTLNIANQVVDTKSETTMRTKTAISDAGGGLTKVAFQVESIASRIEMPGNRVFEFDSTKPVEAEQTDPLTKTLQDLLTALTGSKIEVTIANKKVVTVEGITEKLPVTADEVKAEFQQRIDLLPENPVKPGDTWERTEELHVGSGQTLTFQRRYEYVGTTRENPNDPASKELDQIKGTDLSVLYTVRPNPQLPISAKKSDLKIDSSGHTIFFDRQLGRVAKGDGKSHIKGDIVFGIGDMELNGSLDLALESMSEEVK